MGGVGVVFSVGFSCFHRICHRFRVAICMAFQGRNESGIVFGRSFLEMGEHKKLHSKIEILPYISFIEANVRLTDKIRAVSFSDFVNRK